MHCSLRPFDIAPVVLALIPSAYQISAQTGNERLSWVSSARFQRVLNEPLVFRVGWNKLHQICWGHRTIIGALKYIVNFRSVVPSETRRLIGDWSWKIEAKVRTFSLLCRKKLGKGRRCHWVNFSSLTKDLTSDIYLWYILLDRWIICPAWRVDNCRNWLDHFPIRSLSRDISELQSPKNTKMVEIICMLSALHKFVLDFLLCFDNRAP